VNLLDNAFKFSPAGAPVSVAVRLGGGQVEIAVEDRGPGVDAEEAERIFEPFYRSPGQGEMPGSGLGLAIARGLAQANGCKLTVAPGEGGGSRFVLALPVPAGGKRA
jgi:two-component system sensor histidine kinase KdpD